MEKEKIERINELASMICAALLAMKAALCMGRVSRN